MNKHYHNILANYPGGYTINCINDPNTIFNEKNTHSFNCFNEWGYRSHAQKCIKKEKVYWYTPVKYTGRGAMVASAPSVGRVRIHNKIYKQFSS